MNNNKGKYILKLPLTDVGITLISYIYSHSFVAYVDWEVHNKKKSGGAMVFLILFTSSAASTQQY